MTLDAVLGAVASAAVIMTGNNPDRGTSPDGGQPPIEVRYTSIGDGFSGSWLLQENTFLSDITATVIGRDA